MAEFGALFDSAQEQRDPVQADITGCLPSWLRGSLVRLGPGKYDLREDFVMNHWLDGYAILYKFDIADGKVVFRSQFLQSTAYKRATEVGRPVVTEFGTRAVPDPCKNIFSRMMTSLVDLNTVVGVHYASSHTVRDPSTGHTYNMGSTLYPGLKYHLLRFPAAATSTQALERSCILGSIPSSWTTLLSYYHSFGVSENHVVFIEQPLLLNGLKLVGSLVKGKSLHECLDWRPQEKNKFHVLHKKSGKLLPVKYKSEQPFFLFHHINTFEENGQLVVDVIAYDSPEILNQLYLKNLRKSEYKNKHPAGGRRFVLPLPTEKQSLCEGVNLVRVSAAGGARAERRGDVVHVSPHLLTSSVGYELPTINRAKLTHKYRFFYATGLFDPGEFNGAVVKVDTWSGAVSTWHVPEGRACPGEAQFVARPGAEQEDDGVLLCALTDPRPERPDCLVVLDARTMSELARASLTVRLPFVMHGVFLT